MVHMVQNRNNIISEIILVLIKGETHLREIARTLNTPHSTVLRKINELIKENVLGYKREGKNKIFFIKNNLKAKNYIYSAESYKLVKLLKRHPELNIILDDILRYTKEKMIVLFGSYAKEKAKQDSDVDIYVNTMDKKIKYKLQALNSKIKVKIGEFEINSLLIKEIIKDHIILRGVEEFYEKIKFFK